MTQEVEDCSGLSETARVGSFSQLMLLNARSVRAVNKPFRSAKGHWVWSVLAGWLLLSAAGAEQISGTDEETGLPFWAWVSDDVVVRLVQRFPDQSRGYFIGRGFSSEGADLFARSCVFQTIVLNQAPSAGPALDVDLEQWRLITDGVERPLALKERWDEIWVEAQETEHARIAFRWSLFPTRQRFEPGDSNWGMTSFGVPPGSRFDLKLVWRYGNGPQTALVRGIRCAPDQPLESTQP